MTTAPNLDPARTAVLVDDVLADMTAADWRELAEWVEHDAPPAMRAQWDQLRAATDATNRGLRAAHAILGGVAAPAPGHEDIPEWIRLGALHAYTQWTAGQASTCRHSPSPSRPEPVFAAAGHPGRVVCLPCCTDLEATPGTEYICDGCGRRGPLWDAQTTVGPLIFGFGACDDCAPPRLVAGARPARPPADAPPARTPPRRKRRKKR